MSETRVGSVTFSWVIHRNKTQGRLLAAPVRLRRCDDPTRVTKKVGKTLLVRDYEREKRTQHERLPQTEIPEFLCSFYGILIARGVTVTPNTQHSTAFTSLPLPYLAETTTRHWLLNSRA